MKQRLLIFTGKGGVGKTTLALACVNYLKSQNRKVAYNCFYQMPDRELIESMQLPFFDITVEHSAEVYISKKLNSKTIAAWIMHTHFFKSLFQMIPGLGHMILLGHILNELEQNPELTIVLDSPATGHALTMLESSSNFKRIFKKGLIVDDIEKMKLKLEDEDFLKTFIVALPNEMAIQEAEEVKAEMDDVYKNNEIIINNSLEQFCSLNSIKESDLPDFLKNKIEMEKGIINQYPHLPHVTGHSQKEITLKTSPYLEKIL